MGSTTTKTTTTITPTTTTTSTTTTQSSQQKTTRSTVKVQRDCLERLARMRCSPMTSQARKEEGVSFPMFVWLGKY